MKNLKLRIKNYIFILHSSFLIFYCIGCATPPYQPVSIAPAPQISGGIYYEVQRGDTVWAISRLYGIDVSDITAANNLTAASRIISGQRLFIPGAKETLAITPEKRKLYENDVFIWPCKGDILSSFGQTMHGAANKGIDIKIRTGSDVVASKGGRIAVASDRVRGLGKTIIIDHMDGFLTIYARNSQILITSGQSVEQGQLIAKSGSTGRGNDAFLHFEVRRYGKPQNPIYYLP